MRGIKWVTLTFDIAFRWVFRWAKLKLNAKVRTYRKAYRTRPHRRHGSVSQDQSVANKQIYLFWLSESFQIPFEDVDWSRFQTSLFIIKIVSIINNSLRSEKKWCLKLVDALFFISFSEWPDLLLFHSCLIQRTCQMRLMIFCEWSYRLRLNLHELIIVLQESTVSDIPILRRYGNFLSSGNILVNLCWILSTSSLS